MDFVYFVLLWVGNGLEVVGSTIDSIYHVNVCIWIIELNIYILPNNSGLNHQVHLIVSKTTRMWCSRENWHVPWKNSGWKNIFLLKELRFRGHFSFQGLKITTPTINKCPLTRDHFKMDISSSNHQFFSGLGCWFSRRYEIACWGYVRWHSQQVHFWREIRVSGWGQREGLALDTYSPLKLTANAAENRPFWSFLHQKKDMSSSKHPFSNDMMDMFVSGRV